ncbi:hypothetical protein MY11210_003780 [Beauveria gryllotalpidicola]
MPGDTPSFTPSAKAARTTEITAVDALSTAIVMRDNTTVANILDITSKVDFSTMKKKTTEFMSLRLQFATLVTLLLPMISSAAHTVDLLDGKGARPLLDQARTLTDGLSVAFDTPTGIPDPTVYLNHRKNKSGTGRNNAAEIDTLVLERTRFSDLTGDGKYAKLAQKAEDCLIRPSGAPKAWPDLIGTWVNKRL